MTRFYVKRVENRPADQSLEYALGKVPKTWRTDVAAQFGIEM